MYLKEIKIKNHPYLGDQHLDFVNHKTNKPYSIIAFVGENACGKTTLLDLLFSYAKSEFIKDKKSSYFNGCFKDYCALFLRQNSIHNQAQAELLKSIDGSITNQIISGDADMINSPNATYKNCAINQTDKASKILNRFNDETINSIYNGPVGLDITCGGKALERINGKKGKVDISKLSSGQQELTIKMASLQKILIDVDYVLFDEPETSLHPRWQRTIIKNLRDMLEFDGEFPQIFVATHSEKVLESLIGKEDVQIFKFSKNNGNIEINDMESIPLCLPRPTFSEINYVVFNIPSFDYHNQLIARLQYLKKKEGMLSLDRYLLKKIKDESLLRVWVNQQHKEDSYKTLPVYIRNYYHHPIDGVEINEKDLNASIVFLRGLIKDIIDKQECDIM